MRSSVSMTRGISIVGMDPPRHVRIRNLVTKGFTPRVIARLETEMRRIARRYLDPLAGRGGCEFQET